jgi:ABC-type multidrug transport system ATPase subunit
MTLNQTLNTSSIYTTHSLHEASRICQKVLILVNGEISCVGKLVDLQNSLSGYSVRILVEEPGSSVVSELLNKIDDIFKS